MTLLLIAEAKSIGEPIERIFGGQKAKPGQFPFHVTIREPFGSWRWPVCGGVIISDQLVLSSAECMQGALSFPSNVTVVAGTHTISPITSGVFYPVISITTHPQFRRISMANDISVIKTERKIEFTDLVQPAKWPTSNAANDQATTISGLGISSVNMLFWIPNHRFWLQTNIGFHVFCVEQYFRGVGVDQSALSAYDRFGASPVHWTFGYLRQ